MKSNYSLFLWASHYLSEGKRNSPFCKDLQKATLNQKKQNPSDSLNLLLWQFPMNSIETCDPVIYLSPSVPSIRRNKHADVIVW